MKIGKAYLIYLAALILAASAVSEVFARRIYQKSYLAGNIRKHRVFHHILPPRTDGTMKSEGDFDDTYVTNNRGMRGPKDYEYAKPDGIFRIAVMGDSFTFGVGVKAGQTYSAVLQDLFDRSESGRYEVLNFGMSSYSPILELIYLEKEVTKYKPDLLILALDLGDIHDDYFYEKNLVYDAAGRIVACDPFSYDGRLNVWAMLRERSMLLAILDEKLFQSFRKMGTIGLLRYFRNKIKHVRNKTEIFADPKLDSVEFDRFIFSREGKDPLIVTKHWQRTAKYLSMIRQVCDAHGIRFLLAAYPCGQDVGEDQWAKGRQYWAFKPGKVYDPSFAFSLIRSFAAEHLMKFLSLLEPLRQNKQKTLYYNNDGHWTPEAHRIVARAIFEELT